MNSFTERALALACFLDCDLYDIEESRYDDKQFEYCPRTEKRGENPSFYIDWANDLHKFLDSIGIHVKTWQELMATEKEVEEYFKEWQKSMNSNCDLERFNKYKRQLIEFTLSGRIFDTREMQKYGTSEILKFGHNYDKSFETHNTNVGRFLRYHKISYKYFMNKIKDHKFPESNYIHHYANGFFYLINTAQEESGQWHVFALRKAFNGEDIPDCREEYQTNSGEYLVLTDEEANEKAIEIMQSYIDEFGPKLDAHQEPFFDYEGYKQHCIDEDGRAHFISNYDGEENEIELSECSQKILGLTAEFWEIKSEDIQEIIKAFNESDLEITAVEGQDIFEINEPLKYYIFRTN